MKFFVGYGRVNGMNNKNVVKYKISELSKPKNGYCGKITKYNKNLEPHENDTIQCLAKYGIDVIALASSNMPGSVNPDLLMLGTFWEMKAPTTTRRMRRMLIIVEREQEVKLLDIIKK